MIEAIIFDLDGLLVDSEPCWHQARCRMADEVGASDWGPDDHRPCMGVSTREWAEYMIRRMHLDLPWQEVADRIVGNMQAIYARRHSLPARRGGGGRAGRGPLSHGPGLRLRAHADRCGRRGCCHAR